LDVPPSGTQVTDRRHALTNSPWVADCVRARIGDFVGTLFCLINVIEMGNGAIVVL